ncbi:MAG: hypothetical protein QOE85_890, partial [Actinomycetota bacterium]|nr:hypothetical protein [Actinomycetota bacterium]
MTVLTLERAKAVDTLFQRNALLVEYAELCALLSLCLLGDTNCIGLCLLGDTSCIGVRLLDRAGRSCLPLGDESVTLLDTFTNVLFVQSTSELQEVV